MLRDSALVADLAMLISRLCCAVARYDANNTVRAQALDYLHRKGLGGSPLKENNTVDEPHNPVASSQLRRELHDVIRRYGQESDVTFYQSIGVLEIVKIDLVDMLEKARE